MKIKTLFIPFLIFSLLISINLTSCKKDSEKVTESDIEEGEADVAISFDIGNNSFDQTGDLKIVRDGEDITITGTYYNGNLVFEDVVFYGKLIDGVFTLTTTNYQVQFEAGARRSPRSPPMVGASPRF